MEQTHMTIIALTPSEGRWLTQSSEQTPGERTFSDKIYLAQGADPSDWEEWDDGRKTEWERAHLPSAPEAEGARY